MTNQTKADTAAKGKPLFSVTLNDCTVQTFRSGGPGGQNQNKRDTGVRIIHEPSGARGESREHRTQGENKRAAFTRMANSPQFRFWVHERTQEIAGERTAEQRVAEIMADATQFLVEHKDENGRWAPAAIEVAA